MTDTVRSYLVDPVARTITAVDVGRHYKEILQAIRAYMLEGVPFGPYHTLYADDEGWLRAADIAVAESWHLRRPDGLVQHLTGRALLRGLETDTGEDIDVMIPLEELAVNVSFVRAAGPASTWATDSFPANLDHA